MILGLRPALPVRARGRRGARARARGQGPAARRLQRGRRRRARAVRGGRPARQALRADASRRGGRAWRRASRAGWACGSRPRCSTSCASAAAWTTGGCKAAGLRVRLHQPRGGDRARRAHAPASADARRRRSPTATSARSRSSCAGAPRSRCAKRVQASVAQVLEVAEPEPARCTAARAGASSRPRPRARRPPVDHYDDLAAEEIISLLGSLEPPDLVALREYERDTGRAGAVLGAIDSVLAAHPDRRLARNHSQPRLRACERAANRPYICGRASDAWAPGLPMGTKSFIAVAALVILAPRRCGGVYAYDSSNEDRVANGIRVAGRRAWAASSADEAREQAAAASSRRRWRSRSWSSTATSASRCPPRTPG